MWPASGRLLIRSLTIFSRIRLFLSWWANSARNLEIDRIYIYCKLFIYIWSLKLLFIGYYNYIFASFGNTNNGIRSELSRRECSIHSVSFSQSATGN
jgi:hypothetical protein